MTHAVISKLSPTSLGQGFILKVGDTMNWSSNYALLGNLCVIPFLS